MLTMHNPYPYILEYLAERWSEKNLPNLLERLAPYGYQFWDTLQKSPQVADYSAPENQAYYLLRIFPHHIEPLYYTLADLPEEIMATTFGNTSLKACFFGAGPAPEVIGWLMHVRDYLPHVNKLDATVLDKYAEEWLDIQQNLTSKRLAPAYWQNGEFSLTAYMLDNQASLNWKTLGQPVQRAIREANLIVFQNCLSDIKRPDQFLINFDMILRQVPKDCLIVFNDLNYAIVRHLLSSIEDIAEGIGRQLSSWQDGLFTIISRIEVSEIVSNHYFSGLQQSGLGTRYKTKYYRSVMLKSIERAQTKHLTLEELPVLPLAGGVLAESVLQAQTDLLDTLETLLSPGKRLRLSPYFQNVQFQYLFGKFVAAGGTEENKRELIRQYKTELAVWRETLSQYWAASGGERANLYTADEMLRRAALIAHASWHIPQIQRILLDLLQQRDLPSELSVLICSEAPSLELIALLDFLIALQDVCDLFSANYTVPPIQVICLTPSPSEFDQTLVEYYLDQVEPVYGERLPLTNFVWRTATPEQWSESLMGRSLTFALITNFFTQGNTAELIEKLLISALANSVTLFVEASQGASALFNWRHAFIGTHKRFRSLAPCGAEFGNAITECCSACVDSPIRRRESFHAPHLYVEFLSGFERENDLRELFSDWSYAVLYGGSETEHTLHSTPISLNDKTFFEGPVSLRYLGRFADLQRATAAKSDDAKLPTSDHPDSLSRKGLHYRVCLAASNARKISIFRDVGKHIPDLRFGQQFKVSNCIVERVNTSGDFRIRLTDKTHYELPSTYQPTFLSEYTETTQKAIDRVAYRLFAFKEMRPFQHEILAQALCGKSILGIAATGGGKSECYILPAMLLSGITVVVSPLKSLMQDQFDQRLRDRYGLDYLCTFINGDVPIKERQERLQRLENGFYKLIFLTPEQLERSYTLESLARANAKVGIRYIALDEAHCISQWGHDFRPAYLNILARLKRYNIHPIRIALTATASPKVREDLCRELDLKPDIPTNGGNVLIFSSNRTELNLIVQRVHSTAEKADAIVSRLRQFLRDHSPTGSSIVFMPHKGGNLDWTAPASDAVSSRSSYSKTGRLSSGATSFAAYLERQLEQRVSIYHSGMDDDSGEEADPDLKSKEFGDLSGRTRRTEQIAFIQGKTNIMVCTKGFGMGIDKPNIRLVIHRTPTSNLEAYAQEAGRAGRDGERADVILFYSPDTPSESDSSTSIKSDHDIQQSFISENYIRREDVTALNQFLRTLTPYSEGRLYFTCTQVIRYLDELEKSDAYKWREFPVQVYGQYYGLHLELRKRGEYYQQRQKYIARILAVLFRLRPDIPNVGERVPFLESVQNVRIHMVVQMVNADAILNSNYYFGKRFREAGLKTEELEQLFQQKTLIPLAERLNISLTEASELFNDICKAEGYNNGRWRGSLLDGWLTTPTDPSDWREWRAYAGVIRRENPPKNKPEHTLDDWFPKRTVTLPMAWDVAVGDGFTNRDFFDTFLDHFMAIHDERQRNDWDAYYRLLTEYVGVKHDGSLPEQAEAQPCLRSVMLGYLKTYEVVIGGNCKSCSRCVRDLNFDNFTDEERRAVIVRMEEETQAILNHFESFDKLTPSETDLKALFERIAHEESQHRSVKTYISAWSARLLQDTAGHRGALWLRTLGSALNVFNIDSGELQRDMEQLIAALTDISEGNRLRILIEQLAQAQKIDVVVQVWLFARLDEAQKQFKRAVEHYGQIVNSQKGSNFEVPAYESLLRLCAPNGKAPDDIYYRRAAYELALHTNVSSEMLKLFSAYSQGLSLEALDEQLTDRRFDDQHRYGLCWAWLLQHPVDQATLDAIQTQFPSLWEWLRSEQLPLMQHLTEGESAQSPLGRRAAYELARHSSDLAEMMNLYAIANLQLTWQAFTEQNADEQLPLDHRMASCWAWLIQQPILLEILLDVNEGYPTIWQWIGEKSPDALWEMMQQIDLDLLIFSGGLLNQLVSALPNAFLQTYAQMWQNWLLSKPEPQSVFLTLCNTWRGFCNVLSPGAAAQLIERIGISFTIAQYLPLSIDWHTLPSHKSLFGELMLHGIALGYHPSPVHIAAHLFNIANVEVYLAKPLNITVAEQLLPFIQPMDIHGWAAWFAYFPVSLFTGDKEMLANGMLQKATGHLLELESASAIENAFRLIAEQLSHVPSYKPLFYFGEKLLTLRQSITQRWSENAETLRMIYDHFSPERSTTRAHHAAIVLNVIWQSIERKTWLTPLRYLVQAYAWSGDFESVERLASQFDTLILQRGYTLEQYINHVRAKLGNQRPDKTLDPILLHFAKILVVT